MARQGALLLGHSSSGIKGIFVLPGVIDTDFKGEIYIVVQTLFPPIAIPKGSKIAQLVPLLQLTKGMTTGNQQIRGNRGFGSTGGLVMLSMPLTERPITTVTLEKKGERVILEALLDTGADISIVGKHFWPESWPTRTVAGGLEGVGGTASIQQSQDRIVVYLDGRRTNATITVMPLPHGVSALIGRDILLQLGVRLTTESPF